MKNILILLISLFIAFPAFAKSEVKSLPLYTQRNVQNTYEVPVANKSTVLQGGVSASKELPSSFYGTWSVSSKLLETNNPYEFRAKGSDVWILENNKGVITLSNPITGASASITVDEVVGNTAKFTRRSESDNTTEVESPQITINEDSFHGTDLLVIEKRKNGIRYKMDVVRYEVRGNKISGPTLQEIFSK